MENNKIGILFSGGLESTSLILYYKQKNYDISLLYIKSGYIWEEVEVKSAKKIAEFYDLELDILDCSKPLEVNQLGKVKTVKQNIIPLRNLTLLTFASLHFYKKNILSIAFGLQEDNSYPDTSLEYIRNTQDLIRDGLQEPNFCINTPFYKLSKKDVIKKFNPPLELIFSCTNPINDKRCHKCFKCKKLDSLL